MLRQRVFTYITRGDHLLMLESVDGRYLQPQIPGGTVEAGELPAQAALLTSSGSATRLIGMLLAKASTAALVSPWIGSSTAKHLPRSTTCIALVKKLR